MLVHECSVNNIIDKHCVVVKCKDSLKMSEQTKTTWYIVKNMYAVPSSYGISTLGDIHKQVMTIPFATAVLIDCTVLSGIFTDCSSFLGSYSLYESRQRPCFSAFFMNSTTFFFGGQG